MGKVGCGLLEQEGRRARVAVWLLPLFVLANLRLGLTFALLCVHQRS